MHKIKNPILLISKTKTSLRGGLFRRKNKKILGSSAHRDWIINTLGNKDTHGSIRMVLKCKK